jgi:protein associated with RNAse G/E
VPPTFDGNVLSYIDLDIDVLVQPDFSYQVLDLEEFEEHARLFSYPEDVQTNAYNAVQDLIRLIDARDFPFRAAN